MFRCFNDIFGYCSGEPDWDIKPQSILDGYTGGHCKNDPESCPKYQTLTEQVTELQMKIKKSSGKKKEVKAITDTVMKMGKEKHGN